MNEKINLQNLKDILIEARDLSENISCLDTLVRFTLNVLITFIENKIEELGE